VVNGAAGSPGQIIAPDGGPERAPDRQLAGEQRCLCHRLICIVRDDIIEIKCPKCKRLIRIITAGIQGIEYV